MRVNSLITLTTIFLLLGVLRIHALRIVGGHEVQIESVPFHVAYLLTEKLDYQCGGSILRPEYVMTAAHCIEEAGKGKGYVRAGSQLRSKGGQVVEVAEIFVHDEYNAFLEAYDFAILKLAKPLEFNSAVKAVALPAPGFNVPDGKMVTVNGWGKTAENGEKSEELRGITLMKVGLKECEDRFGDTSHEITDMHICAMAPGKDSCQGDSGGGLIFHDMLVGVVSFGDGCARDGMPGVYADVGKALEFVNKVLLQ